MNKPRGAEAKKQENEKNGKARKRGSEEANAKANTPKRRSVEAEK